VGAEGREAHPQQLSHHSGPLEWVRHNPLVHDRDRGNGDTGAFGDQCRRGEGPLAIELREVAKGGRIGF
jgi:hypothetical protein